MVGMPHGKHSTQLKGLKMANYFILIHGHHVQHVAEAILPWQHLNLKPYAQTSHPHAGPHQWILCHPSALKTDGSIPTNAVCGTSLALDLEVLVHTQITLAACKAAHRNILMSDSLPAQSGAHGAILILAHGVKMLAQS